MPTVAEVVRRYGPEYLERFGATMPAAHKKVLRDIAACRTGELGMVVYRCADCGQTHAMGRSCGDRHCPSCQRDKAEAWLEKQTDRLLPCPYFLVTFTLPAGLRDVARAHQRVVYAALFEASERGAAYLGGGPEVCGHGPAGVLRCVAHLGPDAGVSSPCPLRRARRRAQRRRHALAAVARRLPGAGEGAVDPLPRQVPRPPAVARACWSRSTRRSGIATGWCTRSRPATAGSRCGTWRRMCSAWPSATIGSSRATMAG